MLPQMGRGPEPNLGIGEIAVRLANLAHGYARERVLVGYTMKNVPSGLLDLSGLLRRCLCFKR